MADVHAVISLGLGSPADVPHFVLLGLSINDQVAPDAASNVPDLQASYAPSIELQATYAPNISLTGSVEG